MADAASARRDPDLLGLEVEGDHVFTEEPGAEVAVVDHRQCMYLDILHRHARYREVDGDGLSALRFGGQFGDVEAKLRERVRREGVACSAAAAAQHFTAAIEREPGFARAHAGLSFTAFQSAYLGYDADREARAADARSLADRAVALDPLDPFANLTMGRSYWLSGDIETSLGWFERSFRLSPSYAQGIYAHAWAETMLGRSGRARAELDNAMSLSPLDPFLYAMKGTRALGYLSEEKIEEAVGWIDDAGRSPGANAVVHLVAAVAHEMNGERNVALEWAKGARVRNPHIDSERLFQALPFAERALRSRMASSLARLGVD